MKLFAIAALLFSVNSFAKEVSCSTVEANGDTVSVQLDSTTTEGVVSKTVKGVSNTMYFLKTYILNDSPGFYYYEGLARAPMTGGDPLFFTLKYSSEDESMTLTISELGSPEKKAAVFNNCTFN